MSSLNQIEYLGTTYDICKDELDVLKADLDLYTGNKSLIFNPGYYIKTNVTTVDWENPNTNNALGCATDACSPGDVYYFNGGGISSSSAYTIAFLNSSDSVIEHESITTAVSNKKIVVPENATRIVVNATISSNPRLMKDILGNEFAELRGYQYSRIYLTEQNEKYWNSDTDYAVLSYNQNGRACYPVKVSPGERYKISIYQWSDSHQCPILLTDDDYLIIAAYKDTSKSSNAWVNFDIVIPIGVTKMLVTFRAYYKNQNSANIFKVWENEFNLDVFAAGMFDYKHANVVILGDSISTNGHYSTGNPHGNVPEIIIGEEDVGVELSAYATFYDIGVEIAGHTITADDVGVELTFTPTASDVGKFIGKPNNNNESVTEVWWEVAADVLGFTPICACWSGSSVTSHQKDYYDDDDGGYVYKTSYAWHPAQIRKCGIRVPGTMDRVAPDLIIIYRGYNDWTHAPHAILTDYLDQYPISIPETDVVTIDNTEYYGYIEGLLITIDKLKTAYPETQIVLCTLGHGKRQASTYPDWPPRNGINTLSQYNNAIRAVADYMGCEVIEFDKDGITHWNELLDYYTEGNEYTTQKTHPNSKGHRIMGNRAIRDLLKVNSMT